MELKFGVNLSKQETHILLMRMQILINALCILNEPDITVVGLSPKDILELEHRRHTKRPTGISNDSNELHSSKMCISNRMTSLCFLHKYYVALRIYLAVNINFESIG